MKNKFHRGFTLVEIIIAVGLFALIMVLVSGAYLTMISVTRQTQGITAGIDNLSFALDTMVRTIRTNKNYGCPTAGQNCPSGDTTFVVTDTSGAKVSYTRSGPIGAGAITQTTGSVTVNLTDSSIDITSLIFYAVGTQPRSASDTVQARVIIVASGSVSSGPGKTIPFSVETSATMRDSDL